MTTASSDEASLADLLAVFDVRPGGMAYGRGQVLTEDGRIIASFTQDAMIRTFTPDSSSLAIASESRL